MKEIKFIIPENGERLSVNASDLHAELLKLPAEIYVDLYHMMKRKMENENGYYLQNSGFISASTACSSISSR